MTTDASPVRWYVAVLLLSSEVLSPTAEEPVVDHEVRFIAAADPEAAFQRALFLGKSEEHSYQNTSRQTVRWRFLGLHDLVEVPSTPSDGDELYSFRAVRSQAWKPVTKDRLTVFWQAAAGDTSADELLR